jgi:hypothetical protein
MLYFSLVNSHILAALTQAPSRTDRFLPREPPEFQRAATVSAIWEKLMKYKLILVRSSDLLP